METIRVGMLGTGFMGRTHSNAFNQVGRFFDIPYKIVLKTCCGTNRKHLEAFQKRWGYEQCETDWMNVINDKNIDLIDVVTPNYLHKDMVIEAARQGKMIICEKPRSGDAKASPAPGAGGRSRFCTAFALTFPLGYAL